jgi:hypothetical protein
MTFVAYARLVNRLVRKKLPQVHVRQLKDRVVEWRYQQRWARLSDDGEAFWLYCEDPPNGYSCRGHRSAEGARVCAFNIAGHLDAQFAVAAG